MKDLVVEEIRKIRREIEREYPRAEEYITHVSQAEKQLGKRLVVREPKPMKKRHAA